MVFVNIRLYAEHLVLVLDLLLLVAQESESP